MEDSNKKRYPIRLRNIKDIKAFVNAANEIDGTCEVITGRYRVDAKSLMGVLSVPISDMAMVEVEQTQDKLPASLRKIIFYNLN